LVLKIIFSILKSFNLERELLEYEKKHWDSGVIHIAGIDEAGRGPLAGPVVAAAVIFPREYFNDEIQDSKKLTVKKRDQLFEVIIKNAFSYGIGIVDNNIIDEINILNATFRAMKISLEGLSIKPDYLLIDGNRFCDIDIPCELIVRGDSKSMSIAAASILAKVTRDRIMIQLTEKYPEYNLSKHKGYGTKEHIGLIKKYGRSAIHRKSFKLKGIDY
jgi:ribonuclease HII